MDSEPVCWLSRERRRPGGLEGGRSWSAGEAGAQRGPRLAMDCPGWDDRCHGDPERPPGRPPGTPGQKPVLHAARLATRPPGLRDVTGSSSGEHRGPFTHLSRRCHHAEDGKTRAPRYAGRAGGERRAAARRPVERRCCPGGDQGAVPGRRWVSDGHEGRGVGGSEVTCRSRLDVAPGGQPERYCHRDVADAIGYMVDDGTCWRAMPADFPPWLTVCDVPHGWQRPRCVRPSHDQLPGGLRRSAAGPGPSRARR